MNDPKARTIRAIASVCFAIAAGMLGFSIVTEIQPAAGMYGALPLSLFAFWLTLKD